MINIDLVLDEYKHTDRLIKEYSLELRQLEDNIKTLRVGTLEDNVKAQVITSMPFGSGVSDPTSTPLIQAIERQERRMLEISFEMNRLLDMKTIVAGALKQLDKKELAFIECMYLQDKKLEFWEARLKLDLEKDTAYRRHKRARTKLQNYIDTILKQKTA